MENLIRLISVFICDESNFQKYTASQTFDAYQVNLRIQSGNMQIPLPAEGKWYVILSNELLKANYQSVKVSCELTSNAIYGGIYSKPALSSVKVFPNPVTTELKIINPDMIDNIIIVDVFGKTVYKFTNQITSWIPEESLANGIYYLQYFDSGKSFSEKLILIR